MPTPKLALPNRQPGLAIGCPRPHLSGMNTPASSPPGLTETLLSVTKNSNGAERITLAEISHALGHQARGFLIVLLAIPNCLPSIPGTSAVTGLPLVYLTLQMALARPPHLPAFLARRSVSRSWLEQMLASARPWLTKVERLLHPRLDVLTQIPAERLIGVLGILLSVLIMLPIPFANMAPSLALIAFSLGFIARDGFWILGGLALTAVAGAVLAATGVAAAQAVIYLGVQWLGFQP